jgi:2-dehydropantoate 2-reductase
VILGVKAFALDSAIADMAPAIGADTLIVPLLNGMHHVDALVARFGEGAVLGGVCIVASTIDQQNRIVQLTGMHEIVYGERDGGASQRLAALDAAMQEAGFTARASHAIMLEMWQKWVFLATLGAVTCLMRGTIGEIVAVPGGAAVAAALLDECAAIATASGHPPSEAFLTRIRGNVTEAGSGLASSMYRDLVQGNKVEVEQVIADLLTRAQALGVATPLLAAARVHLGVYQARVESK